MSVAPLISIITVCYNSHEHIERCIKSVINQSYNNIEYIIIDGGSTDGTMDIINKYRERITFIVSEKDNGIYNAMNKGIAISSGNFVGLLNSDDYYKADIVERVADIINSDPATDVIHADIEVIRNDEINKILGSHLDLLENWGVRHPSCFVKRSIYDKYKFNEKYKIAADIDLLLRLYVNNYKFKKIDAVATCFSIGGASTSISFRLVIENYMIRKKYNNKHAINWFVKDCIMYCDELIQYCSKQVNHKILNRIENYYIKTFLIFIFQSLRLAMMPIIKLIKTKF